MFRSAFFLFSAVVVFITMLVFSISNPGTLTLDVAFKVVEVKTSVAFTVAVVAGWLWGALSVLGTVFMLLRERRALKKQLRTANTELTNLRALPVHDAG